MCAAIFYYWCLLGGKFGGEFGILSGEFNCLFLIKTSYLYMPIDLHGHTMEEIRHKLFDFQMCQSWKKIQRSTPAIKYKLKSRNK